MRSSLDPKNQDRYLNTNLKAEFAKWKNQPKWRISIHREFEVLSSVLEREITSTCDHRNAKRKWDWMIECPDCLSYKRRESVDEEAMWGSGETWSDWKVGMNLPEV